jgi:hypothetical protein
MTANRADVALCSASTTEPIPDTGINLDFINFGSGIQTTLAVEGWPTLESAESQTDERSSASGRPISKSATICVHVGAVASLKR